MFHSAPGYGAFVSQAIDWMGVKVSGVAPSGRGVLLLITCLTTGDHKFRLTPSIAKTPA